MTDRVQFHRNHSTADDIATHLAACDASFIPPLSLRVGIDDYAAKLARLAERFEAWKGKELGGLVAAYCNQPESGTAFISSVSVTPAYRGTGIGDQLIRACLDYAATLGYVQVELRVDAENAAARRLYARHGFKCCGGEGEEITLRRELMPPEERNSRR